ncbi:unnamed protein product [Tilletia caries]|uniref:Uncharacterized protein n=3 Tax=Tilletia TaxID=13289 RepID=A0A8X7MHW1_9BASI|nr:hypothetical protein A4X06_0g9670 [Tilletia controversa]CAD6943895.1 unnamed protein product [Tilletia caries]
MFSRRFLFLLPLVLVVATTGVVSAPVPDPMDTPSATLSQPSRLTARAGSSSSTQEAVQDLAREAVLKDLRREFWNYALDYKDLGTFVRELQENPHGLPPHLKQKFDNKIANWESVQRELHTWTQQLREDYEELRAEHEAARGNKRKHPSS